SSVSSTPCSASHASWSRGTPLSVRFAASRSRSDGDSMDDPTESYTAREDILTSQSLVGKDLAIFQGSIADLQQRLAARGYIADTGLAVSLFLALRLRRPLFLEGQAGVGKTALASAIAAALEADLIRLQCYEGLDITHAAYEWDYARQMLEL